MVHEPPMHRALSWATAFTPPKVAVPATPLDRLLGCMDTGSLWTLLDKGSKRVLRLCCKGVYTKANQLISNLLFKNLDWCEKGEELLAVAEKL